MRLRIIALFVLVLAAGTLIAGISFYVPLPPRLPIQDAMPIAFKALGSETNQFSCVSVISCVRLSRDGEWLFMFATINKTDITGARYVTVFFDKTTHVEKKFAGT